MTRISLSVVTPDVRPDGGTGRCVVEELKRWANEFDVTVYTMSCAEGAAPEGVRIRRIWRAPGPQLLRWSIWLVANHVTRFLDRLRRGRADIVFSPGINAVDADVVFSHIVFAKHWQHAGRRVLPNSRSFIRTPREVHRLLYWTTLRLAERFVFKRATAVACPSTSDAKVICAIGNRDVADTHVVPLGVDPNEFSPQRRSARRPSARSALHFGSEHIVLVIGNDSIKKGIDTAVRSLTALPANARLLVVTSDRWGPIDDMAQSLGVRDRVLLCAPTQDVMTYYAASDVLIAPSREDSFGLPPLEAMACGVPVVMTEAAGLRELFDLQSDLVVLDDVEDAFELASRVRLIMDDDLFRARVTQAGVAFARECTWDAHARALSHLFKDVVDGRGQAHAG